MKKYGNQALHHGEEKKFADPQALIGIVSRDAEILPEKKRSLKVKSKNAKEIEKEVRELYADADGNLPDLTTVSRVKMHRVRNFFIGLGVFLVVGGSAAWAASAFFSAAQKPLAAPEITVDVPSVIKSGDSAVFDIHYAAPAKTGITSLVIDAKFPDTFVAKSTDQSASGTNRWVFANISAGQEGNIHITGVVQGADTAPQIVQAHVTYVPENFQSPFEIVASNAFSIAGSLVQITSTAPDHVQPGDTVTVNFAYKNSSTENLNDVAFRITPPVGFVVSSSTQTQAGQLLWKIPVFVAGSSSTAKVVGSFSSDAKGVSPFLGEFGAMQGTDFVSQTVSTASVTVLGGDLVLTTLVNGATSSTPVSFGDTLHMTLVYANRSEASLEDVRLVLSLFDVTGVKGGKFLFDPQSIHSSVAGVFASSTQSVTWTKKQLPGLAKLKPGEEGAVDVTVKLADASATTKSDAAVTVSFQGSIASVNGVAKKRQVQAGSLVFPFISDTKLAAEARYYNTDEIPVGAGPIPPCTGAETLYRAYWTVTNSLHEIQNLEVRATLPKGARYTGKQNASAGVISYDEKTRLVTWTLNKLPTKVPTVNIDFEIGVTPIDTDVGKTLPLLGSTTLNVKDVVANVIMKKTAGALDTTLPNDSLGKGNGVVASGDAGTTVGN